MNVQNTIGAYRPLHGGDIKRFWDNVDVRGEDECWEWKGSLTDKGYGRFAYGGKKAKHLRAHRVSYMLCVEPLEGDKVVMHTCDNRRCCNPHHLLGGSQAENLQDMHVKGRAKSPPLNRGEEVATALLDREKVREIRRSTLTGVRLSEIYGVAQSTISAVRNRRNWNHV